MLLELIALISVSTDFEAGSLGRVERISPVHLRCAVAGQADQDGRNRQASWYYFRIEHAPTDQDIRIDLVDLVGEYNYRPGTHPVGPNTRPVYSTNQRDWLHFSDEQVFWDDAAKELSLRFQPAAETLWIAHVPPYTTADLERLRREFEHHPCLTTVSIGTTVRNRPIPLWTITDAAVPDHDKRVIWIMARQHAWEAGTSWVTEGAVRFLLSEEPGAAALRRQNIFQFFPLADPDGVATGGVRFNANGYDLNRNWDQVDAALMPEIAAQKRAIAAWLNSGGNIDLFITLHNTESADFIEAPLQAGGAPLQQRARRLQSALDQTGSFSPSGGPRDSGVSTTPGKPGRMTVYQALHHQFQIAAFLMELRVERSPRLGRCPTTADQLALGAELVQALAHAASE